MQGADDEDDVEPAAAHPVSKLELSEALPPAQLASAAADRLRLVIEDADGLQSQIRRHIASSQVGKTIT